MKTLFSSAWVLLFTLALLFSCAEPIDQSLTNKKEALLAQRELQTKAINEQLSKGITQSDVEKYLDVRMNISHNLIESINRHSIGEDVYVFIVNLIDGRWFIISGDYSSSPVIAEGEAGGFRVSQRPSRHEIALFESIRNYIIENRTSNYDSAKSQGNRMEWVQMQKIYDLKKKKEAIRDMDPDTSEVESVIIIDTLINQYYPHLTSTTWHQFAPFNNAAPLATSSEKCPVGCFVTAIAQLLYYTHYEFGFPNDIYAGASCNSYYNQQPYIYNFSNPTSTTWDSMNPSWYYIDDDDPYTAALCALISYRSGTYYGFDIYGYYGATPSSNIPSTLSSFYLTGVSQQSFSSSSIMNEIRNDRPVLCDGYPDSDFINGHAYLIDGYKWLSVQHIEVVTDLSGNILEQNIIATYSDFKWGINSGGDGFFLGYLSEGIYYAYGGHIYTGWSQNQ